MYFPESCKLHDLEDFYMQVAGFWKVPKVLNFLQFSLAGGNAFFASDKKPRDEGGGAVNRQ